MIPLAESFTFLDGVEKFGLPLMYLALSLVAIVVLWKTLQKKDAQYTDELKELYVKLDDRSKQFAETITALSNLLRGGGGPSNDG